MSNPNSQNAELAATIEQFVKNRRAPGTSLQLAIAFSEEKWAQIVAALRAQQDGPYSGPVGPKPLPILTHITFESDCIINGEEVKAGTKINFAAPHGPQQEVPSGVVESSTDGRLKARNESGSDTAHAGAAPSEAGAER